VRAAQGLSPLRVLAVPLLALGPAALLVPVGLGRSIRAGWAVPGGILAFLAASYLGRGALGLERYLTALVPFACVAMADGALRLPDLVPRIPRRAAAGAMLATLALGTAAHLAWTAHHALTRGAELRGYEAAVEQR
jgi:hypothetical protein